MKGNLSKKKGLLGDITEGNLDYIAEHLNTEYGKEIKSLKNRTENSEEMIERHNEWIYDLALRTEETEKKVTAIDEKEDKSNKMMVTDDDGKYWSAAMTDMQIYHTIEEHIVQSLNNSEKDKIPSVKAVLDAIKSIKPDVDLSNYFTKEEVDLELGAMRDNFKETFIDLPWLSSALSDYYTKGIVDIKITNIENLIGDINTSIENIIEKYGLGGDAS